MHKLKHIVSSDVLLKIYQSLILSRLHYGILCWGFNKTNMFRLQKKAVRVILKAKYNSHTDNLFKNLKMLKVEDIFKSKCVEFYCRYKNNELPFYFKNVFEPNVINHRYPTRNRGRSNQTPNKQSTKKSFRYFIPTLMDSFPEEIKSKFSTHSLQNIKQRTKQYFSESYQTACTKFKCYICSKS